MTKDVPVANLDKTRRCRARNLFGIRTFSWDLIMSLRTDIQYLVANSVWRFKACSFFTKTERRGPFLSSIKKIIVTFLQSTIHFKFSLFSPLCTSLLPSFLSSFNSIYLHSLLYIIFQYTFGIHSYSFMSQI
jgi:hypothetical protein